MKPLLHSIDFGNEAGDDPSSKDIAHYFVEQEPFSKYLEDAQRILLATAKKGVGKSALIRWMETKVPEVHKNDPLVISVKGSDLVRSCFGLTSELHLPNDYIRDWMVRICAVINRKIGASLKFALTDDQISLVESSEIDGFKQRNILSALSERLTKLLPAIEKNKLSIAQDLYCCLSSMMRYLLPSRRVR